MSFGKPARSSLLPKITRHLSWRQRHSRRGQSLVEFALLLPMLMVLFLGIVDFGRVFSSGITIEAAARDAAEAAAQEYLRNPPGNPPRPMTDPAPAPGDADYNGDTYYRALHDLAARTACREARLLPNTTYSPDDPMTVADDEACATMPIIAICIHDEVDPLCGDVAFGATVPDPECGALLASMDPTQDGGTEASRYVEVRMCYRFTTVVNLVDLQLPLGWGLSLGDAHLQRERVFAIGFYPPPPTPQPPTPPPPPPPTTAPSESPTPTPSETPSPSASGAPSPSPSAAPTPTESTAPTPSPSEEPPPAPTPTPEPTPEQTSPEGQP